MNYRATKIGAIQKAPPPKKNMGSKAKGPKILISKLWAPKREVPKYWPQK
jgi:hypothetical protein